MNRLCRGVVWGLDESGGSHIGYDLCDGEELHVVRQTEELEDLCIGASDLEGAVDDIPKSYVGGVGLNVETSDRDSVVATKDDCVRPVEPEDTLILRWKGSCDDDILCRHTV